MENLFSVLIVGAGPSGLTMAIELTRHGIPCRIIDKKVKPLTTSNALAVQARTLEIWDDQDIIDAALAVGIKLQALNIYADKKQISQISLRDIKSYYPFVLGIPQQETEHLLKMHLERLGVKVEMSVELVDFTEDAETITIVLKHDDGQLEKILVNWLIACDGAHSFVRNKLNLPFQGKKLKEHFVMADLKVDGSLALNEGYAFLSDHGPLAIIPFNEEYTRIIAGVTDDATLKESVTPDIKDFERLIAERCCIALKLSETQWTSGFWINERIIPQYRYKHIFFVGDAAHIHSPVGGQGMNTGIQDAYNLAWKLALVIKKNVNSEILDSYQIERRPIAKHVLKGSTLMTSLITLKNYLLRQIRNHVLAFLVRKEVVNKKIAAAISETDIHYHNSPITTDKFCQNWLNKNHARIKAGDHLFDGTVSQHGKLLRLFDLVRGVKFCVLLFCGEQLTSFDLQEMQQLQKILNDNYPDYFNCHIIMLKNSLVSVEQNSNSVYIDDGTLHQQYGISKPSLYLLRPDKYFGFSGYLSDKNSLIAYIEKVFSLKK